MAMVNVRRRPLQAGSGCLILFALPFAAFGMGMGGWLVYTIFAWLSVQGWVETPARIVSTEFKAHHDDDGKTYSVTAEYTYVFAGQEYKGSRVGLYTTPDNIGSYHQDVYRELDEHRKSGKPFRCYVNPARPAEAILYRNFRWEMAGFQMIFVLVFGGVGFGLLIFSIRGRRKDRAEAVLAAAHPDQPWLWKTDWVAGRIGSSTAGIALGAVSFAMFWNAVTAPLWFTLPHEILVKGNRFALLGLLFPIVGLLLAAGAVFAIFRWRKFGRSVFQMASVPGVVGGQLAGVITTSAKIRPEDGFHLELQCVHRRTIGSGDGQSTSEEIVWQQEQMVAHELLDDQAGQSAIPVVFQIPYDCLPTDETDLGDQTIWRLTARAKVPGVRYKVAFEVPVFKTADSDPNFIADGPAAANGATPVAPSDPDADLKEAGLLKTIPPDGEGWRFVFPMGRNISFSIFLFIFCAIWTGAIVFMRYMEAPILFPIVFGLFDAMIVYFLLDSWFYRSVVDVSSRGLAITGGLFGWGSRRWIEADAIKQIDIKQGMSSNQKVWYNLIVVCGDGKRVTAGKRLLGKRLATAIARQIEDAVGLTEK
jgi:hypothetical protein